MVGSATVGTDPLPTVYNVTGGGAYCAGGLGINVDLDNSELGSNYQLYKDGVAVGGIVGVEGTRLNESGSRQKQQQSASNGIRYNTVIKSSQS